MSGIKPTPPYYPADEFAAITPDSANDISTAVPTVPANGVRLFIGTGGNVAVDGATSGTKVLFKNVPSGSFLPLLVKRVYANADGTTALDIVACW